MNGFVFRKLIISKRDLRQVTECTFLSDGAKNFYAHLFTLPSGSFISNQDLVDLGVCVSTQMVNKFKRELKAARLYYENKDGATNIKCAYLGSFDIKADAFAEQWKKREI